MFNCRFFFSHNFVITFFLLLLTKELTIIFEMWFNNVIFKTNKFLFVARKSIKATKWNRLHVLWTKFLEKSKIASHSDLLMKITKIYSLTTIENSPSLSLSPSLSISISIVCLYFIWFYIHMRNEEYHLIINSSIENTQKWWEFVNWLKILWNIYWKIEQWLKNRTAKCAAVVRVWNFSSPL